MAPLLDQVERRKINRHAAERDTEANRKKREEYPATVAAIPPEKRTRQSKHIC